jgi:hypothetical protein
VVDLSLDGYVMSFIGKEVSCFLAFKNYEWRIIDIGSLA